MASKFNSEFNYRYQVVGETPWEKIKTLKGFLEGRIRAAALEEVADMKHKALLSEIDYSIGLGNPPHVIMRLKADLLELESGLETQAEAFALNKEEIITLRRLLDELYAVAELTRVEGYSDEQMFEHNAALEFTVWVGREIQAEIIATGRPSPTKLRNAMSSPHSFNQLKLLGIIPHDVVVLTPALIDSLNAKSVQLNSDLTGLESVLDSAKK